MESTKKSNKIRDIVRLQQILKKWKKLAAASSSSSSSSKSNPSHYNTTSTPAPPPPLSSSSCINNIDQPQKPAAAASTKTKTISPATKFLKKTLSFSNLDNSSRSTEVVPKGYLAVLCVGREVELGEMKRFVIPTGYLGHQAFAQLLQEAEEEFGFQQEGILKIPCDVPVFHNILNMIMMQHQHQHQNQHSSSPSPTKTTTTTTTTPTSTTKKWSSSSASNSFSLQEYNNTSMVDMLNISNIVINGSSTTICSPPNSDHLLINNPVPSTSTSHSSLHLQLCR